MPDNCAVNIKVNVTVSRREFLGMAAGFATTPALLTLVSAGVHIVFIHAPEFAVATKSAQMSAREAQRAASLLKRELRFTTVADTEFQRVHADWTAVIVATTKRLQIPEQLPTVDIANQPRCRRNVFYLRPANRLAVWHASLERFGAAQLNDRFRAAGIRVDDQAWLGWFAVKILWEAGVRGKTLSELSFDGHKGRALLFNPARTLLQPLYELSADQTRVVAERLPSPPEREAGCP